VTKHSSFTDFFSSFIVFPDLIRLFREYLKITNSVEMLLHVYFIKFCELMY
jgi:hypothetical protein